ncbi:MAG TPA: YafY family protein [Thermoanaerobaculia bacterium]|nr:YafY family protein [Thermoanaerobaculia bacterium]
MRRADRLFLIIHQLRGRRVTPARRLAASLGVSVRTVYRDVADLQLSGVPIEGEAGVGYILRKGSDVPPLMFTREELEALVVGARFTEAFAGRRLGTAARRALTKIEAVLPAELRARSERSRVLAPVVPAREELRERLDRLHEAIDARRVVRFAYASLGGGATARDVEPLCLAFWGQAWTLGAWCRLRVDFRNFRLDRIDGLEVLDEIASDDPARGLRAYLDSVGAGPEFDV